MKKWFLALAALLIALAGCQGQPSPEDILADLESALNAGDVDGAMVFFADDAVVKLVPALPPGSPDTYSGAEEIRAWFESLVADNFEIAVEVLDVDGDTVTTRTSTWMDATREMGVAPLVATETYTIRDGEITGFTWSISEESLAKVQAAMAPPPMEQEILGIWSWETASTYFQFGEDGTYRYDISLGRLEEHPGDEGRYEVEGSVLTFTSGDEALVCDAGERGSYQIGMTQDGKLQLILQEDECTTRRAPSRDPQLFTRLPPSALPPTATPTPAPPTPTATPQPTPTPELVKAGVTDLEYLVGVWEGSDQGALQFDADGFLLVSESLAGLSSGQASRGECWFDGSLLMLADADGSGEGSYAVELRSTVEGDPVSLKLRAVEDPFVDRREILTKRIWTWVEP